MKSSGGTWSPSTTLESADMATVSQSHIQVFKKMYDVGISKIRSCQTETCSESPQRSRKERQRPGESRVSESGPHRGLSPANERTELDNMVRTTGPGGLAGD